MGSVWDVDNWVDRKVNSFIKSFYPTAIARELDLPLNVVFERLLQLVKDRKLILNWEIRCPECHFTITTLDEFPISLPSTIFCTHCQDDVELSLDYIFPVFSINPEYKEHVRGSARERKKKRELALAR
ncbi:hypothetical protein MRY88_09245 [Bacillus cereus]|uniref:Uncharacterized protein n=1 Tax=Bacillus cereus (strain 03BB102) TaxID=572264 RepID=A0A158RK57_BACC3|nr:hypothetical protein [Bacillus cereus]ACO27383.1 conserved hypothetical protein [Bacillus cereus 03BB102]AJG52529.1 hypothetical protein AS54_1933 [Bacillus cereus 03BB102]QPR83015.1 hypothetical protein I6G75_26350 [Bacillus cereus]